MASAVNRVGFLVDGFNVYHSLRRAERDLGVGLRWLDLHALLSSYLYLFGRDAVLGGIHYFSALATFLEPQNPGVTNRHRLYVEALRHTGVTVELSRFKGKRVTCPHCGTAYSKHEEKETDVAISVRLLEMMHDDTADTVVLVSGDTDLAPAVRSALRLYPEKEVAFAFPYQRKNKELAQLVTRSFQLRKELYRKHQLPTSIVLKSGRRITKPIGW